MGHTPGPWQIGSPEPDLECISIISGAGHLVAYANAVEAGEKGGLRYAGCGGDPVANSALIAAAPDLLAALVAIRDYARDSRTGRMLTGEGYAIAEAAIAKAEGRS